ncbi:hypothetical protein RHMOL_Rhmol13G0283100 [Rhododendron molle]|uniref:Uncharacterized protein n=1 Tax=Rhododendron molle TaxID=49168 RepID=A0ACC0LBJ3_RHOML|nr:hypothetical protein RHMOL_Rhmol13G0283100 [Rhododendron molle]
MNMNCTKCVSIVGRILKDFALILKIIVKRFCNSEVEIALKYLLNFPGNFLLWEVEFFALLSRINLLTMNEPGFGKLDEVAVESLDNGI